MKAYELYWRLYDYLGIEVEKKHQPYAYKHKINVKCKKEYGYQEDSSYMHVNSSKYEWIQKVKWMPKLIKGWKRLTYEQFCEAYNIKLEAD